MNRHVYKEYIKEIKMIFPVKGKQERKYIKNQNHPSNGWFALGL